jgi:hypothetical protein
MQFSDYFDLDRTREDDWFDPILTADTQLFIDPFRIYVDDDEHWREAHDDLTDFFTFALELIARSGFDAASAHWRAARRLLTFPEPPEFCLGYGITPFGSGTGEGFGGVMMEGARVAIEAGLKDLTHFEELTLFEDGIGPDRISDIACNVLKKYFVAYTQEVCERHGVEMQPVAVRHAGWNRDYGWQDERENLPVNPWTERGVLLVPSRFLRPLPTIDPADFWDWSWEYRSEDIRGQFNYDLGRRVNARIIVSFARLNPHLADAYVEHVEEVGAKPPYDFEVDPDSEYRWYAAGLQLAALATVPAEPESEDAFCQWVRELLEDFIHNIEQQDGWLLLWVDDKPRKERFVQALLRTAVWRACREAGVDFTGEANAGRGPVDFKFSQGWNLRALAEVKLTNSTQFWHGLESQTPQYMASEGDVKCGFFIAVGYRDSDFDEKRLEAVRKAARAVSTRTGFKITPLFVDARQKESASRGGRRKKP